MAIRYTSILPHTNRNLINCHGHVVMRTAGIVCSDKLFIKMIIYIRDVFEIPAIIPQSTVTYITHNTHTVGVRNKMKS